MPKQNSQTNTEAVDDYLKAILELSGSGETRVTSNALAERLQIRAPSVTGMLQKLSSLDPCFVSYEKHRGVLLTKAGKRRALEVLRHHRLIERFLHEFLDYPLDEVHEEAERLEHFISERLEERIAAKLGYPRTDPHGHLIPKRNGTVESRKESPLLSWPCNTPAIISSISDKNPAILRDLQRQSLLPGTRLIVEARSEGETVTVTVGSIGEPIRLKRNLLEGVAVVAAP